MAAVSEQKCLLHADREAVARCLECRRFFCRECITEHEGRVICSQCLKKILNEEGLTEESQSRLGAAYKRAKKGLFVCLQVLIAVAIIWGSFYYLGHFLMEIPSEFHEDTFWDMSGDEWR